MTSIRSELGSLVTVDSAGTGDWHLGHGADPRSLSTLANHGYQLRRDLQWDAKKYQFSGDSEANTLIDRPGRGEWKLA